MDYISFVCFNWYFYNVINFLMFKFILRFVGLFCFKEVLVYVYFRFGLIGMVLCFKLLFYLIE